MNNYKKLLILAAISVFTGNVALAIEYPIVDTGQSKSYNASAEITAPAQGASFYGQDGQVMGTTASYALSNDGKTVADNITQLTWMRGPNTTLSTPVTSDKKTSSALSAWVNTVNASNYGGYNDWRLPSIKELYSLISFKGTDASSYTGTDSSLLTPFIDSTFFKFGYGDPTTERLIDAQYASNNVAVINSAANGQPIRFGLNFADGRIKGYDTITSTRTEKTFFVQLVRGNTTYGNNSLVGNANGTVSDSATGLIWSKADSGSRMTWQAGLAWAQTKNTENYLGYNDWRLPNAKELQSIINYANAPDYNSKPSIDTTLFDSTAILNENGETDYPYYWTSTTHAKYTGTGSSTSAVGAEAVYISFGRALGYNAQLSKWVDVHGAGAQRSDPKIGPPFAYATPYTVIKNGTSYTGYAFGPQKDAIRGYNFVRLVRGTSSATPQFSLSVIKSGTGSGTISSSPANIDCGALCSASFNSGTNVILTATPASGSLFAGWSGACSNSSGTCAVTMDASKSVTSTFAVPSSYTLSVSSVGSGTVSSTPTGINCGSDCTESYSSGTQVTLSATPATGYTFSGWSGACTNSSGTCSVTMNTAQNVLATFKNSSNFMLTVAKTGAGTVSSSPTGINCGADCTENYTDGSKVTLTATPVSGATFLGWLGNCTGTSSTCSVTMTTAQNVTARFNTGTTTTVFTAPNPSNIGQNVLVTVGVSPLSSNGSAVSGTVSVNGVDRSCSIALPSTTCTLVFPTNGRRNITATYNGNSDYSKSTGTTIHVVGRALKTSPMLMLLND
jgi:uncharacterized repeat protein (TIGR02543 family)